MEARNYLERYIVKLEYDKLEEHHALASMLEFNCYPDIVKFLVSNNHLGIKNVIDIGCAFGHQSLFFTEAGFTYTGINKNRLDFFNSDTNKYIVGRYPFKRFKGKKGDIAVSVLCLGFNCYYENVAEAKEQFKKLYNDFSCAIIYMPTNKLHLAMDCGWEIAEIKRYEDDRIARLYFLYKKGKK